MNAEPDLSPLRARLAVLAAQQQLIDVAYRVVDSPLGCLLLAVTPVGLVRVAFASEDHDVVLTDLSHRISPRILLAPSSLDTVARQLDEYFAGTRRHFQIALDTRLNTQFRRVVLQRLRTEIHYGQTATYAALAQAVGNPHAVRAVGTACASNPIPVIVPCHRIIRTDGTLGGYRGGTSAKQFLLHWETSHTA